MLFQHESESFKDQKAIIKTMESQHPQFNRFIEKPCVSEHFPDKARLIFDLLRVDPEENSNLRIMDEVEDDNLILVHYLEPTPAVRHIRGVIIDTEQEKIVAESFPYTEEYLASSEEAKEIPLGEGCEVTKAHEGTILRVFRGNTTKKWYLSTHRKIDGSRSRWSGPAFGEMFEEVWGKEPKETYLVPGNCYVFLLSHGANRLVCEIPTPCVYHVQTLIPGKKGQMVTTRQTSCNQHPQVRKQLALDISTIDKLIQEAKSLSWKECSGLLVTKYSQDGTILGCWKLVPPEYQFRRGIRGNEPNFKLRYLQLKKAGNEKQICDLFPEKEELFSQVEKDLAVLPVFIGSYFRERYWNKRFEYLPKDVHCILEATHQQFNLEKTVEENLKLQINSSDARRLNALIRFMLQEKRSTE